MPNSPKSSCLTALCATIANAILTDVGIGEPMVLQLYSPFA